MTSNREGSIGKAPPPHPDEPSTPEAQSLPPEEDIDRGNLEEDLQDPDEKRNATDGYAPADDGFEPTTAEEDLEQFED